MKKFLFIILVFLTQNLFANITFTYDIFTYKVNDNNEIIITSINNREKDSIIIPSIIDGKKVTSIGNFAFPSCKSLSNITIPDSVTSIGTRAFRQNTNIILSEDNKFFAVINDILYNKKEKKLLMCLSNPHNVIIPIGLKRIKTAYNYHYET